MKWFPAIAALALLSGLSAACQPNERTLNASDDGQAITIRTGEHMVIELEANPSTGYTWEAAGLDTSVLRQTGETEFRNPAGKWPPGTPGTQVMRFEALRPGSTTLQLVYHRPWETGITPAKTFTLHVTVEQ